MNIHRCVVEACSFIKRGGRRPHHKNLDAELSRELQYSRTISRYFSNLYYGLSLSSIFLFYVLLNRYRQYEADFITVLNRLKMDLDSFLTLIPQVVLGIFRNSKYFLINLHFFVLGTWNFFTISINPMYRLLTTLK